MSKDRSAGFWHDNDNIHCEEEVCGAEVTEVLSAIIQERGNILRERGEQDTGRSGERIKTEVDGGEGRVHGERRNLFGGEGGAQIKVNIDFVIVLLH